MPACLQQAEAAERRMPRNASEDVDFQRLGRVRHRGQGRRRARSDMERSSLVAIKTRGGHIQNVAKTSIWRELFGFDRNGLFRGQTAWPYDFSSVQNVDVFIYQSKKI